MQLGTQATPVLLYQSFQTAQYLIAGLTLQVDVAARRERAKPLVNRIDQLATRKAGDGGKQAIETKVLAMATHKIEYQTVFLVLGQTQATTICC